MIFAVRRIGCGLSLVFSVCGPAAASESFSLALRPWFEARTRNFQFYSCGATQEVGRLAARLEQFRSAYLLLAGTQAVSSPPITVMAFPDHKTMEPFLPVYGGRPANLAGLFSRGSDENLIVVALSTAVSGSLQTIFHEYSHLLLRHNENVWPLWLKEGMAEIYATFEPAGDYAVRIGQRLDKYLPILKSEEMLPLERLFAITHDSPGYNSRDQQGMFYAQSWLLTHYLMLGNNPRHKARFGHLTSLLRLGQPIEQAFTNTFQVSLPAMQRELAAYAARGKFEPLLLTVKGNLRAPQPMSTRGLSPAETCFRLGNQLMRLGRLDEAEEWFLQTAKRAPGTAVAFEGAALIAVERERHGEARELLAKCIQLRSSKHLIWYLHARENFRATAVAPDTYSTLSRPQANEIRSSLEQALKLMPDFGPAHHLLGFVALLESRDLDLAERHIQRATALEPENDSWRFTLAQVQAARDDVPAALKTLQALQRPYVAEKIRLSAAKLAREIARGKDKAKG